MNSLFIKSNKQLSSETKTHVNNSRSRNVVGRRTRLIALGGDGYLGRAQWRGPSPDDVLEGTVLEDGVVSRGQHGRLAWSLQVRDPHH